MKSFEPTTIRTLLLQEYRNNLQDTARYIIKRDVY